MQGDWLQGDEPSLMVTGGEASSSSGISGWTGRHDLVSRYVPFPQLSLQVDVGLQLLHLYGSLGNRSDCVMGYLHKIYLGCTVSPPHRKARHWIWTRQGPFLSAWLLEACHRNAYSVSILRKHTHLYNTLQTHKHTKQNVISDNLE